MRSSPKARALAAALAPLAVAACSALISHADGQCATDADCVRFGATTCVRGGCVVASPPVDASFTPDGSEACATTSDCLQLHPEGSWFCRHVDQTCVDLKSTDCPQVLGDYTADDALLLGALVPVFGPHASTGAALTGAVRLAVSDLQRGVPSATDGGARRPLAVVLCNESNGVTRPGRHLRDDVQVPAILGTADGTTTLSLVSDVAQPGGILVMSPRASTTTLRALSTSGLVWRTCPSDAIEGAALVAVTNGVVLPAVAGQSQPARVAVLHAADVTSTELEADVVAGLVLNGKPATDPSNAGNLIRADYGAPDDPGDADVDAAYRAAVAAVTSPAALPDVILLLGSTQAATRVLPMIEAAWPASRKPQYVVSSGVQTKELLAFTSGKAELRRRIVGTAPGANDATRDAFLARYRASITDSDAPEIFGAAQMYDAVYTLAYAAAAAAKTSLHGNDLSMALRRTLAPREGGAAVPITIGPDGIETAFAAITAGSWLALDGASAPLAFQTTTGEVVTDVQVWCIGAGSASPVFQDSGLSYLAGTSSLAGSLSCP